MAIYADLVSRALLDGDQESDIAVLLQTALMVRLAITTERAEVSVLGLLAIRSATTDHLSASVLPAESIPNQADLSNLLSSAVGLRMCSPVSELTLGIRDA